jgi:hypothetical protein
MSYTCDRGLVTRIYKEPKTLNSKRVRDPVNKWTNKPNRAFTKEEVKMAK